jgi:TrpR-related protein YerC/YecD
MKRRSPTTRDTVTELCSVLAGLGDPDVVADFLVDLCTPAELEALADRWSVVPLLAQGVAYRTIHDRTGVSVTTIGRVARCLEHGEGYRAALQRAAGDSPTEAHHESHIHAAVAAGPTPTAPAP